LIIIYKFEFEAKKNKQKPCDMSQKGIIKQALTEDNLNPNAILLKPQDVTRLRTLKLEDWPYREEV
jgi:hypothetical protein